MESRSTVYKKILDDQGKTQEGSGQYIYHILYILGIHLVGFRLLFVLENVAIVQ